MSEKGLKPCPFCGNTDMRITDYRTIMETVGTHPSLLPYSWSVECLECCCVKEFFVSRDEAIKAWNRRVNDG